MVGSRLGLQVLGADLDPDGQGGRGHTHFAPGVRTRDFVERVVTTFMAGFAAEARLGAPDPDGSEFDRTETMRDWLSFLEPDPSRRPALAEEYFARAQAQLAGEETWGRVQAVAAALLQARRLDADAVQKLL